jgi:rod shape-determining protein MreC
VRKRIRHFLFFSLLLGISVCLLIFEHRNPEVITFYSEKVDKFAMVPLSNALKAPGKLAQGIRSGIHRLTSPESSHELEKQNRALSAEVGRLRTQLRLASEENRQLVRLMEITSGTLTATQCTCLIPAEVLAINVSPLSCTLEINKGWSDGVEVNSTVACGGALVGSVIAARKNSAVVQASTDPRSSISGITEETRQLCLVKSRGPEVPLRIMLEKSTTLPYRGSRVLSSGIDTSIYPKGLVIGTIANVEKTGRGYITAEVTPAFDHRKIEEVVIIPPRDIPPTVAEAE